MWLGNRTVVPRLCVRANNTMRSWGARPVPGNANARARQLRAQERMRVNFGTRT